MKSVLNRTFWLYGMDLLHTLAKPTADGNRLRQNRGARSRFWLAGSISFPLWADRLGATMPANEAPEHRQKEEQKPWKDPERLREAFETHGTLIGTARELGTTHNTVAAWMDRHGIDHDRGRLASTLERMSPSEFDATVKASQADGN